MAPNEQIKVNLIVDAGQHALIVGQNGSGKTAFACWELLRIPSAPIIIYDTKEEPKFQELPASILVQTPDEAQQYVDDLHYDYIIIQPPAELQGEHKILDGYLWYHYLHFKHCVAYIDEATTFQSGAGRAGKGLLALLQRGRSRGISTIISTQRPVRLDRACITEAKKVYVFRLSDRADKKRLDDVIPNFSRLAEPPKHGFYFFSEGMYEPVLMQPIKLDPAFDKGYTDQVGVSEAANNSSPEKDATPDAHKLPRHIWI